MMDRDLLEQQLSELPLYIYTYIDPKKLEFSSRIRYICQAECPMYGKSWACPPAVGEVDACKKHCGRYENCLLIGTIVEVNDVPYYHLNSFKSASSSSFSSCEASVLFISLLNHVGSLTDLILFSLVLFFFLYSFSAYSIA